MENKKISEMKFWHRAKCLIPFLFTLLSQLSVFLLSVPYHPPSLYPLCEHPSEVETAAAGGRNKVWQKHLWQS